ncbi:MAG: polyketide synthase dehydratase domain-containing protein [Planctomycetaceae bacterium]
MALTSCFVRPMIGAWEDAGEGHGRGTIVLDPVADGILRDHVYKDTPLMPAASILESFAEALEFAGICDGPIVLEEIQFLNGVRFFTSSPQTLHVHLTHLSDGWELKLTQEFRNRHGALLDPARLCTKAIARLKPSAFDDWGWLPPPADWRQVVYLDKVSNWMGPSLHGLKQVQMTPDEGWAEIIAPDESPWRPATNAEWRFSPGVLDAALVACSMWVQDYRSGSLQLPMSIRRIWLGKNPAPGSRLRESFHVQEISENLAIYDLRVWDEQGRMILKLDDYQCSLVREPGVLTIRLADTL